MTKLFIAVGVLLALWGVYRMVVFFLKVGDDMDIENTKKDMKHKAELVDDVTSFTEENEELIEKAKNTDVVKKFVG